MDLYHFLNTEEVGVSNKTLIFLICVITIFVLWCILLVSQWDKITKTSKIDTVICDTLPHTPVSVRPDVNKVTPYPEMMYNVYTKKYAVGFKYKQFDADTVYVYFGLDNAYPKLSDRSVFKDNKRYFQTRIGTNVNDAYLYPSPCEAAADYNRYIKWVEYMMV